MRRIHVGRFAGLAALIASLAPHGEVAITSSRTKRPKNEPPPALPPTTMHEWRNLELETGEQLHARGLRPWDGEGLWLFPAEWFDAIPEGLAIHFVDGREGNFLREVTDGDQRFGCLAFGVLQRPTAKRGAK